MSLKPPVNEKLPSIEAKVVVLGTQGRVLHVFCILYVRAKTQFASIASRMDGLHT